DRQALRTRSPPTCSRKQPSSSPQLREPSEARRSSRKSFVPQRPILLSPFAQLRISKGFVRGLSNVVARANRCAAYFCHGLGENKWDHDRNARATTWLRQAP